MNVFKDIKKGLSYASKGDLGGGWNAVLGGGNIPDDATSGVFYDPMGMMTILEDRASQKHFHVRRNADYVIAYFNCPPVSAVINRKAQTFINGELEIVNSRGKDRGLENYGRNADKIRDLFRNPNPVQTYTQFMAQTYLYVQTFGYAIILKRKPAGYDDNIDVYQMWNLPPHLIDIEKTNKMFFNDNKEGIEKIVVRYGKEVTELKADDVFIIKDVMPALDDAFLPESRIKTLEMPINNIIGSYESRNMLINSRGALGMITNKTKDSYSAIPLKPHEKEELHRDFKKLYGLRKGQTGVIISSADLDWKNMVLPTKELMLFEEVEDSNNRICDAYMFPPELLGKMRGDTVTGNMQTATRNLYQDAIIPEAKHLFEQWNKFFETSKYGIEITMCYDHLSVLQPDKKAEAEARLRLNQGLQIEFRNGIITLNDWRRKMGNPTVVGDDVYYYEIKDRFRIEYENGFNDTNIDETFVEDGLNPRENIGDASNINE